MKGLPVLMLITYINQDHPFGFSTSMLAYKSRSFNITVNVTCTVPHPPLRTYRPSVRIVNIVKHVRQPEGKRKREATENV